MFRSLFSKKANSLPHRLYGGLVAQSRLPVFYTHYGVNDSTMARFELLATHVLVMTNALRQISVKNGSAESLSQDIFDLFVADLERGLREFGFADTAVGKRKKKLVHKFYAIVEAYGPALDAQNDMELQSEVMGRSTENLTEDQFTADISTSFARYLLMSSTSLVAAFSLNLEVGDVNLIWPEPARFLKDRV